MAEPRAQHSPAPPVDRAAYAGMRLGIMQPYFFPYLGYFGLIANTDRWIVFDPVQYIRKGWVNRNRVLKNGGGEKYIGVTMADHNRETLLKDMRLAPEPDRLDRIVRHLDFYKAVRAPHYQSVIALLEKCFEPGEEALVPFLVKSLVHTCTHLGIPFNYAVCSEMKFDHEPAQQPGDWALHISSALGAGSYINPPGGRAIFDKARFAEAGVKLLFHEQELPPYDQRTAAFLPGLSIIDVMMFNTPEAIRAMLAQHRLLAE